MKRLLHIIATPRGDESRTLEISMVFLDAFKKNHPSWIIDELNLANEELPNLSQKSVSGKYVLLEGKNLFGSLRETWAEIVQHIERFKTADRFLISTPMWNFSIPYLLKHYIDLIIQPRYLFHYADGKPEGLVKGKDMIIITTRGGQYDYKQEFDFQEPYLRTIFGFVGITDITFVNAEGMDMGEEIRNTALTEAKKKVLENA